MPRPGELRNPVYLLQVVVQGRRRVTPGAERRSGATTACGRTATVERGLGDKTAIIFEADGGEVTRVTYSELLAKTSASSPTA
jgi:hypothetical protein